MVENVNGSSLLEIQDNDSTEVAGLSRIQVNEIVKFKDRSKWLSNYKTIIS